MFVPTKYLFAARVHCIAIVTESCNIYLVTIIILTDQ